MNSHGTIPFQYLQFRYVQDVERKTGVAAKRVQLCHKSLASEYLRVQKV